LLLIRKQLVRGVHRGHHSLCLSGKDLLWLADRAAARFTIFQVNGLGLTHRICCKVGEIRTIELRRRVSGRGRPCSASVILRNGRQLRLLSYKPCEEQRQIVNRLVSFLDI
jgi:hypothetical protein